MGTYISQSNVEDVFGTTNVALWSQLSPSSSTADTARIASAIAYAEEYVENRFRGSRYAVPFSGSSTQLIDWMAKLAGVWLYESRGLRDTAAAGTDDANRVRIHKRLVDNEIKGVLMGSARLNLGSATGRQPTAPVVVAGESDP